MESKNPVCIKNSCLDWQYKKDYDIEQANAMCERCGFSKKEDAMRKAIPLTLCADGLKRKLIPPRNRARKEVPDDSGGETDTGTSQEDRDTGSQECGVGEAAPN